MSVSSRSPTTSGRSAPVRSTVSRCMGGNGLPATCGVAPVAILTTSTAAPLPGAMPRPLGMVRSVFEANHGTPRATAYAASANRPQGMSGPPYPCATASRLVVRRLDRHQPALAQGDPEPLPADDQDPGALRDLLGDEARHRLRGVDDLPGPGRDAEVAEVLGDRLRGAEGVVGHVGELHPGLPGRRQGVDRVGDGVATRVHHPVEVQEGRVVLLTQGPCGTQWCCTGGVAHRACAPSSSVPPIIAHPDEAHNMHQ